MNSKLKEVLEYGYANIFGYDLQLRAYGVSDEKIKAISKLDKVELLDDIENKR